MNKSIRLDIRWGFPKIEAPPNHPFEYDFHGVSSIYHPYCRYSHVWNLQMICFFKNGQVSATGCVNEPVPTELGVKFQPSVWGLGDWVNLGDGGCCCAAWRYTMSTPQKRRWVYPSKNWEKIPRMVFSIWLTSQRGKGMSTLRTWKEIGSALWRPPQVAELPEAQGITDND